jgi:hypothetical protein
MAMSQKFSLNFHCVSSSSFGRQKVSQLNEVLSHEASAFCIQLNEVNAMFYLC